MRWIYLKIMVLLGLCCFSCKKDDDGPVDDGPIIRLVEVSPQTVKQFTDSIIFQMEYEDPNGDVGFENADSMSLKIQDSRLTEGDWFYVPPMAPLHVQIHIKGTLKIVYRNTFLLGNGGNESVTYTLRLKDRAGHWSNTLTTPAILITP